MSSLLTPQEAAERLNVKPDTLARWRLKNIGPRYVKQGHRYVRYDEADLVRWIESRKTTPGRDTA